MVKVTHPWYLSPTNMKALLPWDLGIGTSVPTVHYTTTHATMIKATIICGYPSQALT